MALLLAVGSSAAFFTASAAAAAPIVEPGSESASNVTSYTADLQATVNPNGNSSHYFFQYYNTTLGEGHSTPEDCSSSPTACFVGHDSSDHIVTAQASRLWNPPPGGYDFTPRTFYYRAVVYYYPSTPVAPGTAPQYVYGDWMSFYAPAPAPPPCGSPGGSCPPAPAPPPCGSPGGSCPPPVGSPPPTNPIVAVGTMTHSGANAVIHITVSGPGILTASGTTTVTGRKLSVIRRVVVDTTHTGPAVLLKLRLTQAGRRLLLARGSLRVAVIITFQEVGGGAKSLRRTVTFSRV